MRPSLNPDFWSKITDCNQNYSVHTPPPPYIIAYFSAGVVLMRPSWGLPTFLVTAVFQAFSCVTVLPTPQPRQVETFAPDFDYFRHKGVNDVLTIPFMVSNVKGETIWCQLTFSPPASRWFSSSDPDRFGDPSCGRWWGMGGGIPSGQRSSTSEGEMFLSWNRCFWWFSCNQVEAHRMVLALVSPVFRALLYNDDQLPSSITLVGLHPPKCDNIFFPGLQLRFPRSSVWSHLWERTGVVEAYTHWTGSGMCLGKLKPNQSSVITPLLCLFYLLLPC